MDQRKKDTSLIHTQWKWIGWLLAKMQVSQMKDLQINPETLLVKKMKDGLVRDDKVKYDPSWDY